MKGGSPRGTRDEILVGGVREPIVILSAALGAFVHSIFTQLDTHKKPVG